MNALSDEDNELLFAKFQESYLSYIKLRRHFENVQMEIVARKKLLADMEKIITHHKQIITEFMQRWERE
jgi:hypothetical protein